MPYAAAPTYRASTIAGRRCLLVTVAETLASGTDEFSVALGEYFPSGLWKIVRVKQVRIAGTAATVAPVFGSATNPTSGTAAYVGGIAAAASQDSTNSAAGWVGDGQTLYWRSVPNAAADNSITTKIYLIEGWQ